MGTKIEIPSDLQELGGLKVSLVNALGYGIDSVATRKKKVAETVLSGTKTSNDVFPISNGVGGSQLLVQWAVTSVTISSGELFLLVQKTLPSGGVTTILSHQITATEHMYAQFSAVPDAVSDLLAVNLFPTADTVLNGPWDGLQINLYGSGTYSVTLAVYAMVQ